MLPKISKIINQFTQSITRSYQIRNPFIFLKSNYGSSTNSEESLKSILQKSFPSAEVIKVEDISGGCGAMYSVYVESTEFKGLSVVKQHQAITIALKEQIKEIHGIRIETKVPK